MTKEIALTLKRGDILILNIPESKAYPKGKTMRLRVNGKAKTWVKRPNDFSIPVKTGLNNFGYVDNCYVNNAHLVNKE